MADSLSNFVDYLVKLSDGVLGGSESERKRFLGEVMELMFVRSMQALVPVIVNIILMSVPRFMFLVGIFQANGIDTLEKQKKFMEELVLVGSNVNLADMDDSSFNKLVLEALDRYKGKNDGKNV